MRALSSLWLLGLMACVVDQAGSGAPPSGSGATADSLTTADGGAASTSVSPEVPSIVRDVAIFHDGARVAPSIGPFNTTNDGRISFGAGSELAPVIPEALTKSFMDSEPGTPLRGKPFVYGGPLDSETGTVERSGRTLCDGNPGPRACGAEDCYDVTLVTVTAKQVGTPSRSLRLWGAPVTIHVANPKTASARIASVVANGAPVAGVSYPIERLFEPAFTSDGHLFIGRVGRQLKDRDMTALDADPPRTSTGIDMIYAVHHGDAAPCDVSQWHFQNMTRAPRDPAVSARYGFARFPFRDPEGNPIAPGDDLGGTYPWLDRGGKNLFFKSAARPLYYRDGAGVPTSRFPARCVTGVTCDATAATNVTTEAQGDLRGTSVMGLWTQGRQVMLDGRVNNIDFGLGNHDTRQREVKLYGAPDKLDVGWIRVGTGRQADADEIPVGQPSEPGGNDSTINSLENLFQHLPRMAPKTPRDVVWTINTQNTSEEIAFDDWLDPHALIVSDMMPSLTHDDPVTHDAVYHDGFVVGVGDGAPGGVVRMQNAATALPADMAVPAYGAVEGPGRAEPVALGGIFGRGLWLTGQNRLTYAIPAQPRNLSGPWFTSLFIDARFPNDTAERRVLTYPDGSFVALQGKDAIALYDAGERLLTTVALPSALALRGNGWHHLGLRRGGGTLTLFVDGYPLQQMTLPSPAPFGFTPGTFTIGKVASDAARLGVRGWLDEVRVFNEVVSPEVACNHAHGTLVSLGASAPAELQAVASAYPATSHSAIGGALPKAMRAATYACVHDYSMDYRISVATLPAGTTSLRQTLLQPKGLHFDEPRPDETANAFCLTCHVDTAGRGPSLSPAALALDPSHTMASDPRRQPMQPPALVFGNVPAGYAGGMPTTAMKAPAAGFPVDTWLAP